MSPKKLGTFLLGVGFSQICLYPLHKRYQERSHAEIQDLVKEHHSVIEEAKKRLNSGAEATLKGVSNQAAVAASQKI